MPFVRGLRPSAPESLGEFLDTEFLKLQSTLDEFNAVIGDQQAAIADDASGAANQATVNAILAALRAHGLIAT